MQWPGYPTLWDPVCFTDQWTQSLLSSSIPFTETGSTHSSHTHIQTNSSYTLTPHTHTQIPHSLLTYTHSHTHSTPTYPHIPSHTPHTPSHMPHNHTHTHSTHTQPHTLLTHPLTHTHTHTLLTLTQTHTNTNTEPTGAYTQETWGPSGSAHTPSMWSMWEQPRVPAEVSSWSFHTLGVTGP